GGCDNGREIESEAGNRCPATGEQSSRKVAFELRGGAGLTASNRCLGIRTPAFSRCQKKRSASSEDEPAHPQNRAGGLPAWLLTGSKRLGNWNPVLESHQPLRFCGPPPALLGQRD